MRTYSMLEMTIVGDDQNTVRAANDLALLAAERAVNEFNKAHGSSVHIMKGAVHPGMEIVGRN